MHVSKEKNNLCLDKKVANTNLPKHDILNHNRMRKEHIIVNT